MGKTKLILLALALIFLMVLAGETGYYWATRQQANEVPACPPGVSEGTTLLSTPLLHPEVTDWLEGVSPQMIQRSVFRIVILSGKLHSWIEGGVKALNENGLQEFDFGTAQVKYQKTYVQTSQIFSTTKDEINPGDDIAIAITFDAKKGEIIEVLVSKIFFEELPPEEPQSTLAPEEL